MEPFRAFELNWFALIVSRRGGFSYCIYGWPLVGFGGLALQQVGQNYLDTSGYLMVYHSIILGASRYLWSTVLHT
jgi:hypothetical protein